MTVIVDETPVIHATMSNATYQGSGGYTPQKGVDYFTDQDIAMLVAQIGTADAIANQEILNMFNNLDL